MKIVEIKYPANSEIAGWPKMVFERRIAKSLTGWRFSSYELEECRVAIKGKDSETKPNLLSDLSAFDSVSYKTMAPAEVAALHRKVEEFVGVELVLDVLPPKKKKRGYVVCAAGMLVLFLVLFGYREIRANRQVDALANGSRDTTQYLPNLSPILPTEAISPNDAFEPAPIFNMAIKTSVPADAIKKMSTLVRNDGSSYEVTVLVTPILNEGKKK